MRLLFEGSVFFLLSALQLILILRKPLDAKYTITIPVIGIMESVQNRPPRQNGTRKRYTMQYCENHTVYISQYQSFKVQGKGEDYTMA